MTQTPVKLTFEQYLTYNDGTDNRYELVDGELIEMTPASPRHSDIVECLDRQFYQEVQRLGLDWKVKSGDVGVRTQVRKSRLPNVCVIEGYVWRSLLDETSAVLQVPLLLVVEVVSPGEENRDRDYITKKSEYEELRIPEYWIVDPIENKVTVLLLVGGGYQETVFTETQQIISQTFSELVLTAHQILSA